MENTEAVLIANTPEALTKLCGITLIERLLRTLQRLGFHRVTVVTSLESVRAELAKPSWARDKVIVDLAERIPVKPEPLLIIPSNLYCDSRLLRALCQKTVTTQLIDPSPPENVRALVPNPCGPILQIGTPNEIDVLDAARVDDYIVSMRRHLRPLCFAPSANLALAERVVLDSAQKGTLDLPAYVHSPIEKWIVSHLCRTKITPNQITIFTAILSATVTLQFAFGWLISGTLLALAIGILDGLDGKQARVKVETTELGEWEHKVDAVLESSWWLALAVHFSVTGELPNALALAAMLLLAHIVDGFARRSAKRATGRNIDDVSRFDRVFRLIDGRRNVYVWALGCGLLLGHARQSYVAICFWGVVTAVVHTFRAFQISFRTRPEG